MSAQKRADDVSTEAGKEVAVFSDDPFIAMVERLATNEKVDPDKLEKLVTIQMRIMDRNAEAEFNAALSRVQAKIDSVVADSYNPQTNSRYAKLRAIHETIKPIYTAEGFSTSFTQADPKIEGNIRVEGVLRHAAGHSVPGYAAEVELDDKGIKGAANKTKVHGTGSSLTYARRYCECMMFDIAIDDDTDGNVPNNQPPPAKMISHKQANQLIDMMLATDTNEEAFAKHMKVPSIEEMPEHKFAAAMKKLKEKQGNA